jgi:uncharacterized repeat protein (TIGR01451 family)
MLKRTVLVALNRIRRFSRIRFCVSNGFQIGVTVAVAMVGGFLLLCACARRAYPTATGRLLSTRTAVPIPARTSLPALSPTLAGHDSSPADLVIRGVETLQTALGETTVYTLTVRNDGPAPATGIVLTDALPGGLLPVWTRPAQVACRRQGQSVGCDVGDLRANDAITATLDLSVGGDETLMTGQPAGVTFSAPSCTIKPDTDQSLVTCRLSGLPPGAEAQVRVGFTVSGSLTGRLVHTAAVAANEPDPDRSNDQVSLTVTVGEKERGAGSPGERPAGPDLILRAEGPSSVIAGRPFTRTFTVVNRGSRDATGVRFESPLPLATVLNASAPGLPLCERRGDLVACVLRDPEGDKAITFTLLITGYGEQPVIVEPDALMPGWPVCSVLKEKSFLHIFTCDLGVLHADQMTRVQMSLTAGGVQERLLTHIASASAREADLNPLDNSNTTTMTVRVRSDLLVISTVSGPARVGETLCYTLTIVNAGPSDADGVTLVDTWSPSASLISATSGLGTECRIEREAGVADVLRCSVGRLGSGETITVTVDAELNDALDLTVVETLTHVASVVSDQIDPNLGNNELIETIPLGAGEGE